MLERELSAVSRLGRGMPVSAMVEGMPAPCFALSQRHEVLRVNAPATGWIGTGGGGAAGPKDRPLPAGHRGAFARQHRRRIRPGRGEAVSRAHRLPEAGSPADGARHDLPRLVRSADDLAYLLMIDLRTAV